MTKITVRPPWSGYQACFNCYHWTGWAEDTNPLSGSGTCRRFPQAVPKGPAEWCGEHHASRGGGSYQKIEDAIDVQRREGR